MAQNRDLKANSILFWLVALIAVGIIFIGTRFLVLPLPAAEAFGVPAEGTRTLAYLWAKGTRDIVSGLLVIALLWLRVGRRVLAVFIGVAALIPSGTFFKYTLNWGPRTQRGLPT